MGIRLRKRLSELEAEVDSLQKLIDKLIDTLNKSKLGADIHKQWLSSVTYDHKVRELYLWQLFRNPGESDAEMRERFFRALPDQSWDPVYHVRLASAALARKLHDICESMSLAFWLDNECLANALQFGGFSPTASNLVVGMFAEDFSALEPHLSSELFVIEDSDLNNPQVDGTQVAVGISAIEMPVKLVRAKRAPEAFLHINISLSADEWKKSHSKVGVAATDSAGGADSVTSAPELFPLKMLPCYYGRFPIPADAELAVKNLGFDITAMPEAFENRSYSDMQDSAIEQLQCLVQQLQGQKNE